MTAGVAAPADHRPGLRPRAARTILIGLAVVLAAIAIVASGILRTAPAQLHGVAADGRPAAPDFALGDQHGKPFRLREARGNVVLLVFGYTNCPDACPLTLATWARARTALADDARRVRFVFVSVDPVRDSAQAIGRFIAQFDPGFIGVTGPSADVEDVVIAYGAYARSEPAHDGAIAHTEATFLIDPDGRLIEALPSGTSAADIAADVRVVLGR